MLPICTVVWPTMSCFADWSKCHHVTFIIIEWSTCRSRQCIIAMIHGHMTFTKCKRKIYSMWFLFTWYTSYRVHSAVQRHQSVERPILRQISSLKYPKIQWRQVIMNVLHPSCVWPPRWSPPVLWRRFEMAWLMTNKIIAESHVERMLLKIIQHLAQSCPWVHFVWQQVEKNLDQTKYN